MTVRQYLAVSIANLSFLALGFLIGREVYIQKVHAQTQNIVPISPGVTTGTFGAGLILAHEIQSDSLVVNGYDLLKINQNTLNYLSTQLGANPAGLQSIITNSKADKLYTVKNPAAPNPTPEKKP